MKRFQFAFDGLVEQVLDGRKTATVDRLEDLGRDVDANNHAIVLGERYEVVDSALRPRCTIRVTGLELCRWDRIPERLWRGEVARDADEFRRDHVAYFGDPPPDFEFAAIYFELVAPGFRETGEGDERERDEVAARLELRPSAEAAGDAGS